MSIRGSVAGLLLAASFVTAIPAVSAASVPEPGVTGCDLLVTTLPGHNCLLPWPNDAFTKKAATATGRVLNIPKTLTPANISGVHVNTTYQNLNSGFSPGSEIIIHVPNLSLSNSGIPGSTNIGASLSDSSPIVLYDTVAKKRIPYFAELDAQNSDAATQLLLIHPAINLGEGHRIDVVLRNLKDSSNATIPQLAGEAAARAGTMSNKTRGAHLKWIVTNDLTPLKNSDRTAFNLTNLYASWDFTVAAGGGNVKKLDASNLADPAITMREQAYKLVGKTAPSFRVTNVSDNGTVHEVDGSFQVPTFLKNCPTTQTANYQSTDTSQCRAMNTDKKNLPLLLASTRNATTGVWSNQIWANFRCVMPSTISSAGPAAPTVYGHGLLGGAGEVVGGSFAKGVESNMMGCATDWSGMSSADALLVAATLGDMSNFHTLSDHMLQGMLNFQFLARLINSTQGFATSTDFQSGGAVRFQVGKCQYMGYSQGGIMGGALSAISNEWTRVVLGVPGENYGGLLLNRSVDWNEFASFYNPAYPNATDQQLGLQLAQLLWDRGENDGYAQHLTASPYGNTKAKQVFIIENYGDHQVTNVATEVFSRTIGAKRHAPVFDTNSFGSPRSDVPVEVQWGLANHTYSASTQVKALVELWDYGTPTPPTDNHAPDGSQYGSDPHGYGRRTPGLIDQIKGFQVTGLVSDICLNGSTPTACVGVPGR